jgi:hypothetical protein
MIACLFVSNNLVYGQTNQVIRNQIKTDANITAATILSPEQMKRDIDYFFEVITKVHPDIYAFADKDSIEKCKERYYSICSKPMQAIDFNKCIYQLNNMFDSQTSIYFNFWKSINNENNFFPVPVNTKDGKMYLYDTDKGKYLEILSINGETTTTIYNQLLNQNEVTAYHETRMGPKFPSSLYLYTNIRPPFSVVIDSGKRTETIEYKGINIFNAEKAYEGLYKYPRYGFRIYPEKSIAIIDYNTCSYNLNDSFVRDRLNEIFDDMFQQVSDNNIQHLFLDISRNEGGNSNLNSYLLKHIHRPDTVKLSFSVQNRYDPYSKDEQYELDSMNNWTNFKPLLPRQDGYSKQLYIIQGRRTSFPAMEISEWLGKMDNVTLIGEQTGRATGIYTNNVKFFLPESQIPFWCSHQHWNAIPNGRKDQGIVPDIPVKLNYDKPHYELNDLLQFMEKKQ